jgi:hypothetical protein
VRKPPSLFLQTVFKKLRIFCLEGGLCLLVWKTAYAALFGAFFHKKMHQQIGREDSIQTGCRRMRKLEGLLYEAAEEL